MTSISYIMHTLFLDDNIYHQYIPQNDGMRRPVTVIAPKGCIFNPNFPRASFSRFNQANLLADCVILILISSYLLEKKDRTYNSINVPEIFTLEIELFAPVVRV